MSANFPLQLSEVVDLMRDDDDLMVLRRLHDVGPGMKQWSSNRSTMRRSFSSLYNRYLLGGGGREGLAEVVCGPCKGSLGHSDDRDESDNRHYSNSLPEGRR